MHSEAFVRTLQEPESLSANGQESAEVRYCEEYGGRDVDWIQLVQEGPTASSSELSVKREIS
jgi:hypothetical protein